MTPEDPRFAGMIDLLRRTGASATTIRYSEPDEDEKDGPTVWLAIVHYGEWWDAASGASPSVALVRLCEQLLDGGRCAHCQRPSSFVPMGDTPGRFATVLGTPVCWITWHDEEGRYVQDCGGAGKPSIEAPV